jgi:hypothetical protein
MIRRKPEAERIERYSSFFYFVLKLVDKKYHSFTLPNVKGAHFCF